MINPFELEKINIEVEFCYNFCLIKNNKIPNYVGLYFIFDCKDNLIYVGYSNDIRRRTYEHAERDAWFQEFADKISFFEYNKSDVLKLERKYISKYNTRFNGQSINFDDSYTEVSMLIKKQISCGKLSKEAEYYYRKYCLPENYEKDNKRKCLIEYWFLEYKLEN